MNPIPVAKIEPNTTDDPECGVALAIFVAGCRRNCGGCQNPDLRYTIGWPLWDVDYAQLKLSDLISASGDLIDCIVFVGGEWMLYQEQYAHIAEWAQSRGLRTVLYTGDDYEMLPESVRKVSDWVIDGEWRQDLPGVYPPSINQRVFHRGEHVKPEELPLYQHLSERVGK